MKASHKQVVNILKGMGYVEFEIYPDLKKTILRMDDVEVTVVNSTWKTTSYKDELEGKESMD